MCVYDVERGRQLHQGGSGMRRYLAVLGVLLVAVFAVTSIGVGLPSQPTTAQDRTGERLSALETQVANLEERVDALESDEGMSVVTPVSAATPTPVSSGEDGILEISGTGSIVTENFPLEAGRYQVTVDLASGCCISLFIYDPSGNETLLFNEIFSGSSGGTASDIYRVPESGMYFIDSQNTDGEWTVTFEER